MVPEARGLVGCVCEKLLLPQPSPLLCKASQEALSHKVLAFSTSLKIRCIGRFLDSQTPLGTGGVLKIGH